MRANSPRAPPSSLRFVNVPPSPPHSDRSQNDGKLGSSISLQAPHDFLLCHVECLRHSQFSCASFSHFVALHSIEKVSLSLFTPICLSFFHFFFLRRVVSLPHNTGISSGKRISKLPILLAELLRDTQLPLLLPPPPQLPWPPSVQ